MKLKTFFNILLYIVMITYYIICILAFAGYIDISHLLGTDITPLNKDISIPADPIPADPQLNSNNLYLMIGISILTITLFFGLVYSISLINDLQISQNNIEGIISNIQYKQLQTGDIVTGLTNNQDKASNTIKGLVEVSSSLIQSNRNQDQIIEILDSDLLAILEILERAGYN